MPRRTIKQVTFNIWTYSPVPEDAEEMEWEQAMAAGLDFGHAEDSVNDQLPVGYYCRVDDANAS
jgi:hypothetical protein